MSEGRTWPQKLSKRPAPEQHLLQEKLNTRDDEVISNSVPSIVRALRGIAENKRSSVSKQSH